MWHLVAAVVLGLLLWGACLWLRPGPHRFPHPDRGRECYEREPEAAEPLIPPVACFKSYSGGGWP